MPTKRKPLKVTPDAKRESSHARGYDARWRKARLSFLADNPLCVHCAPRVVAAKEVDHIVPHRGDYDLFWDQENWQGLCSVCHSRKTATEDGGFGNKVVKREHQRT